MMEKLRCRRKERTTLVSRLKKQLHQERNDQIRKANNPPEVALQFTPRQPCIQDKKRNQAETQKKQNKLKTA